MTLQFDFNIEGVEELERALNELPRSVGRQVLVRTGRKALKPVHRRAKQMAPNQRLKKSIRTSTKVSASQQRDVSVRGGVTLFVGSNAPDAHLIEWGTGPRYQKTTGRYTGIMPPDPFMRPAWDTQRDEVLDIMRREIWNELVKGAQRLAKQAQTGKLSKRNRRALSG